MYNNFNSIIENMFTRGCGVQVIVCMNYIFNNYNFKKNLEKNYYLF